MKPAASKSQSLSRLLYTSRCTIAGGKQEMAQEVQALTDAARIRNRAAGLTGSLLVVEDTFIQVLEGPAANIETVFEAICCDLRHTDVSLIDLAPISTRMFPQWDMALLTDGEDTTIATSNDLQEIRLLVGINAHEAERHMRDLLLKKAA